MNTININRKLLEEVDLISLIEQHSSTRFEKPYGNGYKRTQKGACPWCSGRDRFAVFVNDRPQRYKCGIHGNGCGKSGDAITFLREYENMSFAQAYATLAGGEIDMRQDHGEERQVQDYASDSWQKYASKFCKDAEAFLWSGDPKAMQVLEYLVKRKIRGNFIKGMHLGATLRNGKPFLVIPWHSILHHQYTRVTLRDIDPKRRYTNLKGSSNEGLYNSDELEFGGLFGHAPVMLVEGEIDAISIMQEAQSLITVVATGSTSNGRVNLWLVKLALAPHVFVSFDSEPRGEESAAYWLRTLNNSSRWRTSLGKDANDMLVLQSHL